MCQLISTLLEKPINHELLVFDHEIAETLTGTWESQDATGYISTIYIENNRLRQKSNVDSLKNEYFMLSKTKFVDSNLLFFTLAIEDDKPVFKINGGSVWRKTKG